ncbi:MAG: pre-mRNA-splicing factor syf2 [Piccolia ochrophora]|nr:MAG: pre-mRNA-splicing factor syf2 [Piccolia ochrophora]
MPPSKRRKMATPDEQVGEDASPIRDSVDNGLENSHKSISSDAKAQPVAADAQDTPSDGKSDNSAAKAKERQERFKALQARAKKSADRNMKEAAAESQRLATDPNLLSSLSRKHAFASHNLLKADTAAAGDDFERKRAWDWTIDESEKWDKRMEKKGRRREDVAFQDYTQDARKVYKRQLRELKPDLEGYEKDKVAALERAAMSGGLDIVEMDDGELVAVDKDGTFYSTADNTDFVTNRPDKAAVDRLVSDLRKAEESRLKKRRDRAKADDDPDITYINKKNQDFNNRLKRFYDKYTTEIRESFERGTMI